MLLNIVTDCSEYHVFINMISEIWWFYQKRVPLRQITETDNPFWYELSVNNKKLWHRVNSMRK